MRVEVMFPVSPYTKCVSVLLVPPDVLLTNAPMIELRVMAVDANNVEAMMLLRRVCTAKTPFFSLSLMMLRTHDCLLRWFTPMTVFSGLNFTIYHRYAWYTAKSKIPSGTSTMSRNLDSQAISTSPALRPHLRILKKTWKTKPA